RESAERHCVERPTKPAENQHCNQQRERDGHQADQPGTPTEEKEQEHQYDEEAALNHGPLDVRDRALDEIGLTKNVLIHYDVSRNRWAQSVKRRLDRFRRLERVGPGLFRYEDEHAGLTEGRSISDFVLRAEAH